MQVMRPPLRSPVSLLAALAACALTPPAVAAAADTPQPGGERAENCLQTLNEDRAAVHRFQRGGKTLSFGRVVVTPTRARPHSYCVRVQFGGRTVFNGFGQSSYELRDDRWVNIGGLGDTGGRSEGYTRSIDLARRSRTDLSYSIKRPDGWYRTTTISLRRR